MRRITVNTPLVVSLTAIVLAAIVALWQLPPVLGATITPRPGDDPMQAKMDQYLTAHQEDLVAYRARFDGRSLFFKPNPPPKRPTANDPSHCQFEPIPEMVAMPYAPPPCPRLAARLLTVDPSSTVSRPKPNKPTFMKELFVSDVSLPRRVSSP